MDCCVSKGQVQYPLPKPEHRVHKVNAQVGNVPYPIPVLDNDASTKVALVPLQSLLNNVCFLMPISLSLNRV